MPKYTNAGINQYSNNGNSNQQFKGWSLKGLSRYNELFQRIKKIDKENMQSNGRKILEKKKKKST